MVGPEDYLGTQINLQAPPERIDASRLFAELLRVRVDFFFVLLQIVDVHAAHRTFWHSRHPLVNCLFPRVYILNN